MTTPAYVQGPKEPALWFKTLGTLVDEQAARFEDRTAIIVPWQSVRLSFRQLGDQSRLVAKALLRLGLRHGDPVGIMAGNCFEYIEVFLGGARIGCPVVVLNNTYTPEELRNAARISACKVIFIASKISRRSLASHIAALRGEDHPNPMLPELRQLISIANDHFYGNGVEIQPYAQLKSNASSDTCIDEVLRCAETQVSPEDVLNLQFTSGTTGAPKAAMLTHINLINNGRLIGNALQLTPDDIICCPPPLFHCFGLVIGTLGSLSHGAAIMFPSDSFDAKKVVDSIMSEDATILLGVPTMFVAELEVLAKTRQRPRRLRAGLSAGAAVSPALMEKVREKMGPSKILNAYGMTETSPITFMTTLDDSEEKGRSLGRAMPHSAAKIIDLDGKIVARGQRGELCTSGYSLQKGYWRNEEKTREVMKRDEDGVLWMHTGDEVMIDNEGYAHITGRIKDIIIRGGENIFPQEIEERLMSHPSVSESCVVGLKNERYGEVVASFLKQVDGSTRPSDEEIRQFVVEKLGRHKAPQYVFWIGDAGVGEDFPKTGSGKYQKHILQGVGNRLIGERQIKPKI